MSKYKLRKSEKYLNFQIHLGYLKKNIKRILDKLCYILLRKYPYFEDSMVFKPSIYTTIKKTL